MIKVCFLSIFQGIVRALKQYKAKLIQYGVSIYVRRGGPNYQEGLRVMRELGESTMFKVYRVSQKTLTLFDCSLQGGWQNNETGVFRTFHQIFMWTSFMRNFCSFSIMMSMNTQSCLGQYKCRCFFFSVSVWHVGINLGHGKPICCCYWFICLKSIYFNDEIINYILITDL